MQRPSIVAPQPLDRSDSRIHSRLVSPEIELQRQLTRQRTELRSLGKKARQRARLWQVVRAINHWAGFAVVVVLVVSQFACLFWSSQTTRQYMKYGEDPTNGPHFIEGDNDEPYSDRSLLCVRQGRLYRPIQLSAALASSRAEFVDTTGSAISAYRVVRREEIELRNEIAQRYVLACNMLAATLRRVEAACVALGYKPANEDLHIVDGIFSNVTQRISDSLPVLSCLFGIMPFTRVREPKTAEWLRILPNHGAKWRNGWLEDPTTGQRWYSGLSGSPPRTTDKYGLSERQFDLLAGIEIDCSTASTLCHPSSIPEWWGDKFFSIDSQRWFNSVAVSNGTRYGLFLYEATHDNIILSIYDVATLISNTTVATLLFRWLAAVVVLSNAYRRGYSQQFLAPGVGCLACTRSFELLRILLLPRMTNALAAFFTAGSKFEGEQRAISEAWFVIYPAIAEVMLCYYSILNAMAKILRRRMSDEFFGPSLIILCLLHWLRQPLAISGMFEFDGRIATVMTAEEYERLRLVDFFSSDVALRLNGNVRSIFGFKLVLLALNLLPLVFAKKLTRQQWPWVEASRIMTRMTSIERTLGVRADENGGLGVSFIYHEPGESWWDGTRRQLSCYELVRLGYIVFGDAVVMPLTDWLLIVFFSFMRSRKRVSSFRVLTFRVRLTTTDVQSEGKSFNLEVDGKAPTFYHTHEPILLNTSVWDIEAVRLP